MPATSDQETQSASSDSPGGVINQMTGFPRQMASQAAGIVGQHADNLVPADVRRRLRVPFTKRLWIILTFLIIGTLIGWQYGFSLIGWWIGGLIGFFLLDVDHLLDVFFLHPDDPASQQVKQALKSRNWSKVWEVLIATAPQRRHLVLHTIIFEVVIAVLAIYVATSSGGLFPKALILAFWFRILTEQIREYMSTGKMASWFWQIKDPVPPNLQAVFLAVGLIVWIIISLGSIT